jgi:replicative DNA helicase
MAKVPLENPPLERAVLGSLLADTNLYWQVRDRIRPELFTVITHGRIATIFGQLVDEGRDLSIPGVVSRLGRDDDSQFSPEGYLATLVADEAEADQFQDYLRDLEDMWARREMAKLGGELIRQSTDDNGLDAMGRLEKAREKMEEMGDPMGTSVKHAANIAQALISRVDHAMQTETTVGLDLGIKAVQDLCGSLMPGRLYTLSGPPGSGKSALAYQIAEYVARTAPVLFESIEMEDEEVIERDLSSRTGISADKIERAALNNEEIDRLVDAAGELVGLKLYIDSSTSPTVATIRAKAMRMKRLKGLGLLVIDHLLYIAKMNAKAGEFDAIRQNLQALKKLAKDLGIPILLLTQLKKEFSDGPWEQIRRPSVGDLYGGSAPEQESDVVMFIHREEYLLGRKEPAKDAKGRGEWEIRAERAAGKAELILGKRRGGKGFGIRTLYFDAGRVRFLDQAPPVPAYGFDFGSLPRPGDPGYLSEDDRGVLANER